MKYKCVHVFKIISITPIIILLELQWTPLGLYLKKCFEIMNIVEPSSDLDILEETHPEDSKDEHYEEEKKTNVEKSRKGHHQREEQSPDTLGSFDKPQHSTHLGNPGASEY